LFSFARYKHRRPATIIRNGETGADAGNLINSNDAAAAAARPRASLIRAISRPAVAAHIDAIDDLDNAPSRPHQENHMNANAHFFSAKSLFANSFFSIAAIAACTILSAPIQAKEKIVTVAFDVSTAGLDLKQPAGARNMYARLQNAAYLVCGPTLRVSLVTVGSVQECYETALGNAVRSAKQPQLTTVYLQSHTLQQAANHGIAVPVLVAAR
jgi:UrcA family protein